MFEMKDEYLTGIKLIDDEHRELFHIAQEAYEVLTDEFIPDKYDNIVTIINKLRDYTKKHFADEEEYMESIHYKRMFTQKIEHTAFVEKLDAIDLNDADENQSDTLINMLEFLGNWLVHHILENDKLIGKDF
jgi:hemerythrin